MQGEIEHVEHDVNNFGANVLQGWTSAQIAAVFALSFGELIHGVVDELCEDGYPFGDGIRRDISVGDMMEEPVADGVREVCIGIGHGVIRRGGGDHKEQIRSAIY